MTLAINHWEAALLYLKKTLSNSYTPRPSHPRTVPTEPPTLWHRWASHWVKSFLERSLRGRLDWDLPNGHTWSFGAGAAPAEAPRLRVLQWDFFLRLIWDGDLALGDGWVAQEWDSQDLVGVIRFLIDNRQVLDDRQLFWTRWPARLWGRWRQWQRGNSLSGSRRNIRAHYDLGNQLYRHFLDADMYYSSAYYAGPHDDLAQAQRHKVQQLLTQARLDSDCHLLEIGCGWGSLAIEAVRQSGCRVTGITLSQQQLEWARQAVATAGLSDRIEILLCDYRQIEGRFDRIISCEMLEAVGHENYPSFFAALERLLRPQGLAVLQVITVPDFSYSEYRRNQDWIQKEIFPGALCPSLTALLSAASLHSQLVLEHCRNIGPHYARTLSDWRRRFQENWPQLRQYGYDEAFGRAWNFYLGYCQAAFASRNLADMQLVMTRPKNPLLLQEDPPWLS